MVMHNEGKIFSVRPHPEPWPKIVVTQMLTRDLFAVDNLLVSYR